jgi:hypothetical protein
MVVLGVVWGLPRMPHYQDWMPYGYELGGMALVLLYLFFGFGSLGLYSLIIGGLRWMTAPQKSAFLFKVGIGTLALTLGCVWGYLQLMDLTLSVQ